MPRLGWTVYSIIAPTLAGVAVVVALVSGLASLAGLLGAAAGGAVAALPLSRALAQALDGPQPSDRRKVK